VHPSLRGYTTAVAQSALDEGAGRQVADELGEVEDLLARENRLTSVLTDSVVPVPSRRAVLEELLASRVRPETLRIVTRALADGRGDQFAVAVHEARDLVRVIVDAPDDAELDEQVQGRSAARHMVAGYAAAVFETLASVTEIEQVEDELFRFARIVEANPDLRSALSDPGRSNADRKAVVVGLLAGRAHPATIRLASAALDGRIRDLVQILDWLVEQAADARGWRVARVHAAREIDDAERAGLDEALRRLTGRPVELQVTVEPELLSGVVVQVGDLLVDASARHRLEQLEEHLLGTEGMTRGAVS
jgi:F-type H+-transporting ATPase subunit delta